MNIKITHCEHIDSYEATDTDSNLQYKIIYKRPDHFDRENFSCEVWVSECNKDQWAIAHVERPSKPWYSIMYSDVKELLSKIISDEQSRNSKTVTGS